MLKEESIKLFQSAKKLIPGGVNSPVRAYGSVGLTPPFIKRANGSKIFDVDGNEFIDYVSSWGAIILGHANEEVVSEIIGASKNGTSFGAPTQNEVLIASMICDAIPSIEMVRMVNSGTEAVMSAIRLARGFTERDMVLKFEGCYHGHSDGLLVKAGSGALTTGVPTSAGVPNDYSKNTMVASYNDCEELETIFRHFGTKLAAVIVEPIAGNMGLILPDPIFLITLREFTNKYGVVLIFDEVITGFRLKYGAVQSIYNITPDLTILGKIIGGGLPVGAYGGRMDIMSMVSPTGPVYQAGTLSGNPIAMAAGIKTLTLLRNNPYIYTNIENKALTIENAYKSIAKKYGIPIHVNRIGSMICPFFSNVCVNDFKTAMQSDTKLFSRYFEVMHNSMVYIPPSQFEVMFLTDAHDDRDIELTIAAIELSLSSL